MRLRQRLVLVLKMMTAKKGLMKGQMKGLMRRLEMALVAERVPTGLR
jgi:hypothetical protein